MGWPEKPYSEYWPWLMSRCSNGNTWHTLDAKDSKHSKPAKAPDRSRHHGPMYRAHEPTSRFCMRHGSPANRNLQNLGFFRGETNEYQLSQKRTIIFFKSGSFQSDFLYFLPDFPSFFASRHGPAPGSSTSAPGLPLHGLAIPRHPGPSIATEGAGRRCGRHGRHGTVGWGRRTEVQLAGEGLDKRLGFVYPNFINFPKL